MEKFDIPLCHRTGFHMLKGLCIKRLHSDNKSPNSRNLLKRNLISTTVWFLVIEILFQSYPGTCDV